MRAGNPVLNGSQLEGRKGRKERRKGKATHRVKLHQDGCLLVTTSNTGMRGL